jgi:hypothetical protein
MLGREAGGCVEYNLGGEEDARVVGMSRGVRE